MYKFHFDRRRYFEIQVLTSRESIVPFIEKNFSLPPDGRILEIGCGEGGVLKGFIEKGHRATGVEMEQGRICDGMRLMEEEVNSGRLRFIADDIFNICPDDLGENFDLIILKDVIEHIPDKASLFLLLKKFLTQDGAIFIGFPPWQMPFGGHQQICRNKYLSRLPWLHLLPRPLYKKILAACQENVSALMDIYDSRVSIEGFERQTGKSGYRIYRKKHFLLAPIYRYKFGIKECEQLFLLRHIPYLRNLFTTAVYYLIVPAEQTSGAVLPANRSEGYIKREAEIAG